MSAFVGYDNVGFWISNGSRDISSIGSRSID